MKLLSKKEQKKVCNAIVANTVMALKLLDLDQNPKRTIGYTEHLIENTIDAILAVGGWKAMLEAKETIFKYQNSFEEEYLKEYAQITEYMEAVDQRPKFVSSLPKENEYEEKEEP